LEKEGMRGEEEADPMQTKKLYGSRLRAWRLDDCEMPGASKGHGWSDFLIFDY
jgi:hypothetical protein